MPEPPLAAARKVFEEHAKKLAFLNNHDLHGFSPDHDTPTRSKAYCRKCGQAVYVAFYVENHEGSITGPVVNKVCESK